MGTQCWAPKRFQPGPQTIIKYDAFRCQSADGHVACCRAGDTCLEGGICKYGKQPPWGAEYYVAGCTDENFNDPSCNRHCFTSAWPEFTPLNGGDYACCNGPMGSKSPDCNKPTDETWQGPAPDDLKTLVVIPASPSAGWEPPAAPSPKKEPAPTQDDPAPKPSSKPSSKPQAQAKPPSKAAPKDDSSDSKPDSNSDPNSDSSSSSDPPSPSTTTLLQAIAATTPGQIAQAQPTVSLGEPAAPAAATSVGSSSDASINGASGAANASAGGLDTSSKIGLGVGIGIGLPMLILMGAIVLLLLRRRRSARSNKPLPPLPPVADPFPSENLPAEKSAAWSTRDFYATSKRPHSQALAPPTYDPRPKEMAASPEYIPKMHVQGVHVQEMQGSPVVSELPGEYRRQR